MRIVIMTGGSTPERNVALSGARQVARALRDRSHTVSVFDTASGMLDAAGEAELLRDAVGAAPPDLAYLRELASREMGIVFGALETLRQADVVFLVLHGRQGEGGLIQAVLEAAGVCFTGSGFFGSALAMDKAISKSLLRAAGIPTPDWVVWPAPDEAIEALGMPLVVKPSKVGSTLGLSIVEDRAQLEAAVAVAREYDDTVLVERFVRGREFTVGVLGGEALAVGEIIPDHAIFDYECKYTPGMSKEIFPADLPAAVADAMRAYSLSVHNTLNLCDFSRVDFLLDAAGGIHCLEANTLPGMTATSLLPQSAGACGVAFGDLCERICRLATERLRPQATGAACCKRD